jgi:hypothetical protein
MDGEWITLALFLFFFVILPLLQGIQQRRKGSQQELPETEEEWAPEVEQRTGRGRIEPEEWAAQWDESPRESPRQVQRGGERSAWEDLGLDDLFREPEPEPLPKPRPEPRAEPRPEQRHVPLPEPWFEPAPKPQPRPRIEVPAPVPVLHRPVPVAAEPRVASLERIEVDREAEHQRFRRRYVTREPAPKRAPARQRLLPDLHDAGAVRRAIVASEVLGPPRALRELEQR